MLPSLPYSLPSGFGQLIAQKFGRVPVIAVTPEREDLERQLGEAGISVTTFKSIAEMPPAAHNGSHAQNSVAIWFYPADGAGDARAVANLAAVANKIVLVPESGVDVSVRRPGLVALFAEAGLWPDYESDLHAAGNGAVELTRSPPGSAEAIVPGVESTVARLQRQVRGLERSLRTRMAELEAADRHISRLEEKLLKWKEAKRQLKQLKAEKQALRKSPERKVATGIVDPFLATETSAAPLNKMNMESPSAPSSITRSPRPK